MNHALDPIKDRLADFLSGHYRCENENARFALRSIMRVTLDSDQWHLRVADDGTFEGFFSWLRTDSDGSALIQWLGLAGLAHLAIPIALDGEVLILLDAVISPSAPRETAHRLWAEMLKANPEATTVQTSIQPRRKRRYWLIRKIRRPV